MDGSQPLDPRKTIFVGGVPRPLRAGKTVALHGENWTQFRKQQQNRVSLLFIVLCIISHLLVICFSQLFSHFVFFKA